ncbi:MAG: hypothetical protein ABW224_12930 [Kibdelosporangium sp.]
MSFDLVVWRVARRVTVETAKSKYDELRDRAKSGDSPSPEMLAFVAAVRDRLGEDEPWASEPEVGADYALLSVPQSLASRARDVVRELASQHGLVCFDRQDEVVHQAVAAGGGAGVLQLFGGSDVRDPTEDQIRAELGRLSADRWFLILETSPNHYVQVGVGRNAEVAEEEFVLEYREGAADRHWRTLTVDVEDVVAAFVGFPRGDMDWVTGHSWVKAV